MYLNQTPTGFNLGEKLNYKVDLRESGRERGVPLVISTLRFSESLNSCLS